MLALESAFFNSPPRKTVRCGGTVTEVLPKYKKVRGGLFFVGQNTVILAQD